MVLRQIITEEKLFETAKELSRKKFKPGFDGMSMEGACSWIYVNGERLCRDIFNGHYRSMPASGFRTAKAGGGFRSIARLTALDTILQHTVNNGLVEFAEERFYDGSFAYRTGRGVDSALKRYVDLANGHRTVAKIDLCACFDNINHEILKKRITDFFGNEKLCELLMLFVKTPFYIDGEIKENEKGLLQGMPLSPLLCNVYFDTLDAYFESNNIPFVRYADDIVFFGDNISEVNKLFSNVLAFIENNLGLRPNRKKSRVDSPTNIRFLGHKFLADKKGIIAFDANADIVSAYHSWHSGCKNNGRGRYDLVSDGILRQKDFSLLFDTETIDTSIPTVSTNTINIYSDVILDSGFLNTAMKNGITVNLFDKTGRRVGSIEPTKPMKSPKVTHEQLTAYYDKRRLELAKEFVLASIHNSLLNVRYHNKHEDSLLLEAAAKKLDAMRSTVRGVKTHEKLLLAEAQCRELYYGCFDSFIKKDGFPFEKRTRRPPENEVNAMISFGNSVLYNLIACEIEKSALDVRVGFLHSTNTRYASLNLDIAEIFKPLVVDRTVFSLINKGEITADMFVKCENNGVYLNQTAKRLFLQAFYEKLETVITHKDEKISYNTAIAEEIRKLIRYFRDKEKYKAFRQVR